MSAGTNPVNADPNTAYDPSLSGLDDCGCCAEQAVSAPVEVWNRPGLSAVAYRIGTHSSFKRALLERLSSSDLPALAQLQTRSDEDLAIALLDAWSTVADVLTFYQERIANESYLRTAAELPSLRSLSRLIGYELRPGVAASAWLAFKVEDARGGPQQAAVGAGTKVQSIPGPGQLPQVFETAEKIVAHPEWNAIRPRMTQPQNLSTGMEFVVFKGVANNLRQGDRLLIRAGNNDQVVKRVLRVVVDHETQTTQVNLVDNPAVLPFFIPILLEVANFILEPERLTASTLESNVTQFRWKQADLQAQVSLQKWSAPAVTTYVNHTRQDTVVSEGAGVFVFRQKAAIFGHNAPKWDTLPASQRFGQKVDTATETNKTIPAVYPTSWENRTLRDEANANEIYLDNTYSSILPNSLVALDNGFVAPDIFQVTSNTETSRSDFTLNAKVTRLDLNTNTGFSSYRLRSTTVLAGSELLELADLPIKDPVEKNTLSLDGIYLGLQVGQKVILTGERNDLPGVLESEVLALLDITFNGGYTLLTFATALQNSYVRSTVRLNANVALATHGETKQEALGSGDSSQPFQRMALRQPPLTYVSASNPSGAETTLQVWVNELRWQEVPSFFGHGPDDRIYITRTGENGAALVEFGDGKTGARLPTGRENVRAVYRKGIGEEGLVDAGAISLLTTRPLGIREVSNPLAASGAAGPESLADARRNAPLTVLTLDRIVSLQDYEDFARAFTGVAKALATWTWNGHQRGVFVTVAGPKGAEIPEGSNTYIHLLDAMQKAGDPLIALRVQSYRTAYFQVQFKLRQDPAYQESRVLADVETRMRDAFSFEARHFGQPVFLSEVITVIQSVPGVLAVDVDSLYRTGDQPALNPSLIADAPKAGTDTTLAAELLFLDPRPLNPGVIV